MQASRPEAPFQFNFGGNTDFPTAYPANLSQEENPEEAGSASVEVRPSLQVTAFFLSAQRSQQHCDNYLDWYAGVSIA